MGALSAFGLMAALPTDTWIRLAVWTVIGLAIYLFYGKGNSRAGKADDALAARRG